MNEQKLKGAVMQFNYHGWLVSFSQVFPRSSVAIFKGKIDIAKKIVAKIDELNARVEVS